MMKCNKCNGYGYTLIGCSVNYAELRGKCDKCSAIKIKNCINCKHGKTRYKNKVYCKVTTKTHEYKCCEEYVEG